MGITDFISGKKRQVTLHLADAATREVFATTAVKAGDLPESFAPHDTIHIDKEEWSVEEAHPASASEMLNAGAGTLYVRKVEKINPQDVWFTIPSMSAELPETSKAPVFDREGEDLHEDEWRQLEFLPKDALPKIEADMKGIRNVLEHHAKRTQEGFGIFRECYIREHIGEPGLQLPFDECLTLLNAGEPQNIRIVGQYVKGGFYVETPHSAYYGLVENDTITTLCLDTFSEQTAGEVRELTSRFGLVFADWCACKIVTPDA